MDNKDKELQEAIEKYNNHDGHAAIMYDVEEEKVWADVFESDDEYKEYGDEVLNIVSKTQIQNTMHGNNPVVRDYVVEKIAERIEMYHDLKSI